uniref:Uncharacterized protein n=1 Tax=Tanacetum cinerariifolium TaxID=118510 RepID=A0A699IWZ3_TANCI|nr:hypothetical protein [Tanacetum cinerariifolium]
MFNTIRVICSHRDTHVYNAILPVELTNQEMLDSKSYKEYYDVVSRAEPPKAKTKYKKKTDEYVTSPKSKTTSASKGTRLKTKAKVTKPDMKKQPTKKTKAKGLAVLSEAALSKAKQIKLAGDNDDGDNDDEVESDDHDDDSDDERKESDGEEILGPNLTNVDQTEYEEEDVDEGVHTPSENEFTDEEKLDDEEIIDNEEDGKVLKELYEDVIVNLEQGDAEMTDANPKGSEQLNISQESGFEQEEEEAHVNLTPVFDVQKADKPKRIEEYRWGRSSCSETECMQQDQEFAMGDNDEQPVDKEVTKADRRRIILVTRLTIMKKYDYGHLKEIEVRRDNQQLYKFKEGDFKRLRLQDIEDMLLLLVQQKLANLTIDERYDLNTALRMFTRCIVIQKQIKSQEQNRVYTLHFDPHGIIYVDSFRRKRLMHTDELHKFSDGTLNDVRSALYDIAAGIKMEYLPIRKWRNLDKKRAWVIVQEIDKQLYHRRLMRNLEKFVGGRPYRQDLRLIERTI